MVGSSVRAVSAGSANTFVAASCCRPLPETSASATPESTRRSRSAGTMSACSTTLSGSAVRTGSVASDQKRFRTNVIVPLSATEAIWYGPLDSGLSP